MADANEETQDTTETEKAERLEQLVKVAVMRATAEFVEANRSEIQKRARAMLREQGIPLAGQE